MRTDFDLSKQLVFCKVQVLDRGIIPCRNKFLGPVADELYCTADLQRGKGMNTRASRKDATKLTFSCFCCSLITVTEERSTRPTIPESVTKAMWLLLPCRASLLRKPG